MAARAPAEKPRLRSPAAPLAGRPRYPFVPPATVGMAPAALREGGARVRQAAPSAGPPAPGVLPAFLPSRPRASRPWCTLQASAAACGRGGGPRARLARFQGVSRL